MTYQEYERCVLVESPWAEFDLPVTGRVLDVGSGSGWAISTLVNQGLDTLGVDIVPSGRRCVGGSATQLPFQNSSFDGILCLRVLQHIQDSERALQEFARVLKPGGFLLLATGNSHAYTLIALRRGGLWTPSPNERQYELYDVKSLTEFLHSNGFRIMAMRTCHFMPRFLSKIGFTALHRFFAQVDGKLGGNPITRGVGPVLLAYARRA